MENELLVTANSTDHETNSTPTAAVVPRTNAKAAQEWLRAGFFSALGVGLLTLGAFLLWHLTSAVLAVITPFVVAGALALLLDPLADKLEQRGMSRALSVGLVFGVAVLIIVGLGLMIVPALVGQANQLSQNGPEYVDKFKSTVNDFLASHHSIGGYTLPENFDSLLQQVSDRVSGILRGAAGNVTGILIGSVSAMVESIVVLIVTFYLLMDIDRLRARFFYLLPERVRHPVRQITSDVGGVFSDYLRGLLIVCSLYGVITAIAFTGLGFMHPEMRHYALLIGALAGLLYAVPYVGALATALVTFLVGFAAGGIGFAGIAVGVMLLLNQIFDNIVTPRVVGGGVGLNPVVSIFALVLGGEMFGLWGMLLSVPLAASVQVILFRVCPKLTTPTPPAFLLEHGVRPTEAKSSKILEGKEHKREEAASAPQPAKEPISEETTSQS